MDTELCDCLQHNDCSIDCVCECHRVSPQVAQAIWKEWDRDERIATARRLAMVQIEIAMECDLAE